MVKRCLLYRPPVIGGFFARNDGALRFGVFLLCCYVLVAVIATAGEPPLPAGLAPVESKSEEAALPAGLVPAESKSKEPALPAGLAPSSGEPALPAGLGGAVKPEEPALPAGLEPAPAAEETPVAPGAEQAPEKEKKSLRERLPEIHGFGELRLGARTQDDPAHSKSLTIGETRLQLQTEKAWKRLVAELSADLVGDGAGEEVDFDLRQARLTISVTKRIDVRVGRQVLTWGTGDMLFINDLFPKDWNSFFIGRDVEYLKAPSDAVKAGWYHEQLNVEFVYTPQFAPDRFITGERVSFWNPMFRTYAGNRSTLDYNAPSTWFEDDEFALRVYRNLGKFEVAIYGYSGYWKSPGGQRLIPFMQAAFPKLRVYGASIRGPIGKGVVNAELGYYDSYQDPHGDNMFVSNSEFRFLAGYERELMKNFTGSAQYYLEWMMDHDAYRNSLLFWLPARDEIRHVLTVRLTKLLLDQNLNLSFFAYFSPSDLDAYLRPKASYKINDHWMVELGGNVFLGASKTTFFGQFQNATNIYAGARYSF